MNNNLKFVIILTFFICGTNVAQVKFKGNPKNINMLISDDILGDVNRNDARAAIELGISGMIKEISNENNRITPEIITSTEEIIKRVKEGNVHVIGLFSLDFFKYKDELNFEPFYTAQENAELGSEYVVLTRKELKINTLADLKFKRVLTLSNREEELVRKWLFVEMTKAKIDKPLKIINSFIKISKASKRVFSLFLKNADACIVTKSQYESMCELNPQLNNQLKILAKSPSYLVKFYCLDPNIFIATLEEARNMVSDLNKTSNANQILKLVKANKFASIEAKDLVTTEKLYNDYKTLIEKNK